jgi:hypothetical protein
MGATMKSFADRLGVRVVVLSPRRRFAWSLGLVAGAGLLAWLDAPASPFALHAPGPIQTAAIVSAIVTGIEILAGWVAAAAEVTAAYVWIALQWLGTATATLLRNTGAMFAKVWDATKIVWNDVLRPALVWVDDQLKRVYQWLQDTFRPVFDFLQNVRDRLNAFYTTFVRPVVDTIEFLRQINRVLLAFHITFLQGLDRALQQIEQRIEEPILWINAKLNEIWNALELVVTLDGFFQRLTLIRSMDRYAPQWMRIATNKRTKPLTSDQAYAITRGNETQTVPQITDDIRQYLAGADVNIGEVIDQATARSRDYYTAA